MPMPLQLHIHLPLYKLTNSERNYKMRATNCKYMYYAN